MKANENMQINKGRLEEDCNCANHWKMLAGYSGLACCQREFHGCANRVRYNQLCLLKKWKSCLYLYLWRFFLQKFLLRVDLLVWFSHHLPETISCDKRANVKGYVCLCSIMAYYKEWKKIANGWVRKREVGMRCDFPQLTHGFQSLRSIPTFSGVPVKTDIYWRSSEVWLLRSRPMGQKNKTTGVLNRTHFSSGNLLLNRAAVESFDHIYFM